MSYRSEMIQVAAVALAALQNLDTGDTSLELYPGILFDIIYKEREKQEYKWGVQNRSPEQWLIILMEEVGESAKAILEQDLK